MTETGLRAEPDRRYGLTLGQRWIAAAGQNPGKGVPLQRVYRIRGDLDTKNLLATLRAVIAENESLRLRLHGRDGRWKQSFPDREPDIDAVIPRGGTESQRFIWALDHISRAAAEPLDLESTGPFSVQLVRLDQSTHLLSLTIDHLAVDAIGFDLLERELGSIYSGRDHRSPGRFVAYLDRCQEDREELDRSLAYWLRLLDPLPSLPPKGENVRARRACGSWSGPRMQQCLEACRRTRWSPFMAVLAAQSLLMARLGGGLDMVLSVPLSNRVTADEQELVANLAILAYLPIRLALEERLGGLRSRVRRLVVEAMAHRHLDLWELGIHLSRAAVEEGKPLNLVTGCNYFADPLAAPTTGRCPGLYIEQLYLEEFFPFALPSGAFLLSCQQVLQEFRVELLWDPLTWPLSGESELFEAFRWVTCAEDSASVEKFLSAKRDRPAETAE
jgi:hypothetical protein